MAREESHTRKETDPFELWREWLDQSERLWNSALNELMGSEAYGQASSKVMEAMLEVQASMNEASQRYFSALNLPTRTDLMALADRLSGIEARLAAIERTLDDLRPSSSQPPSQERPRPKRTRKAPGTGPG